MNEVSTLEGWREYVDASYERPLPVGRDELAAMTFGDRAIYNVARARYSQAGAFVKTPPYRAFQRATREPQSSVTRLRNGDLNVAADPARSRRRRSSTSRRRWVTPRGPRGAEDLA